MNNLNLFFIVIVIDSVLLGWHLHKQQKRRRIDEAIQTWAPIAYDVVNDIVTENGPGWACDKTVLFARKFSRLLESENIKPTQGIIGRGTAIAQAMHYQEKQEKAREGK